MRGVELVFAVSVVVVLQKQLDGVLGGAVMLHHAVHEQRLGRGDVLDLGDEIILLHLAEQDVFALIVAALGEQLIAHLGGRAAEGHLVELRHVVAQAQPHAGVLRDKELHRVHDALGAFVKAVGARVAAAHHGERTAAVGSLPREEAEEKEGRKVEARDGQCRDRGAAAGPFCFVYGSTAVLLAVGFTDLRSDPVYLFFACTLASTVMEWLTAKLLERLHRRKWWDYSGKRFNLNGYVCLQYSLLWGVLGTASVLWLNGLLLRLCQVIPSWLLHPLVWAAVIVAALDQIGSAVLVGHYAAKHPVLEQLNQRLGESSDGLRRRIALYVEKRIQRAYPAAARQEPTVAQNGETPLSAADLLWLFVVGAFLGDLVETVFCRLTAGVWMSRSSLVWGPFSVVWGLALALTTVLLRQNQDKSDRYLFVFGTVMGGVYEYVCSAVTELLFGTVFWDYSKFKFNLGGRINLLYCFFWGMAAVVWMRYGYPVVMKCMTRLRSRVRPWMTVLLAVFMAVNMVTSSLALARYDARTSGVPAANAVETYLDAHFDNARMERIYPNAKKVEKAG
mgnify:CR=1 FL=1